MHRLLQHWFQVFSLCILSTLKYQNCEDTMHLISKDFMVSHLRRFKVQYKVNEERIKITQIIANSTSKS